MWLNEYVLRPMDAVCMASSRLPGRLIRLWTSRLRGLNGMVEMWKLRVCNHVGLIVEHSGKLWVAEMLATGLEINSLRDYTLKPDKERIVAVRRLSIFDNAELRLHGNAYVIQLAHTTVPYDYKGSPGAFLGLCGDGPKELYCSEMAETVANKAGATWDNWQLRRSGKLRRIAPIEIQFGAASCPVYCIGED